MFRRGWGRGGRIFGMSVVGTTIKSIIGLFVLGALLFFGRP